MDHDIDFWLRPLATYGTHCARLLALAPDGEQPHQGPGSWTFAPLGPGRPNQHARSRLEELTVADVVEPHELVDREFARCCIAALWLRHGCLDESHAISQQLGSPSGSYLHGLMHRREPDYSNANYWFRRTGPHPVHDRLIAAVGTLIPAAREENPAIAERLQVLATGPWQPPVLVDWCKCAANDGGHEHQWCRRIADLEWQLVFDACYQGACGVAPN